MLFLDVSQPYQMNFQDSASSIMWGINLLHNHIFYYLLLVSFIVGWLLFISLFSFYNKSLMSFFSHGTLLELFWTMTPAFILIAIAIPSLKLLYLMDEVISPGVTIKIMGHQWYWSIEYSDYSDSTFSFDSYMIPTSDLEIGQLSLLDVDQSIMIPIGTCMRFMVTSNDVLHSFAVPSLGIKIDAMPGSLNQTSILVEREGVFYGQCSELCGIYHGFMPIVIQAINIDKYLKFMESTMA